jgi:hypothetical protein
LKTITIYSKWWQKKNRKDIDLRAREDEQKQKELKEQRRKNKELKALKEEEERKKQLEEAKKVTN